MPHSHWKTATMIVAVLGAACAFVAGAISFRVRQPGREELPTGISEIEFKKAEQQFKTKYKRQADRHDALSWLGESAFNEGRWETVVASFEQIPSTTPRYGHAARLFQGRAHLKLYQAAKAEANLLEFLRLEEESQELEAVHYAEALLQLQYLYGIELRFEERDKILAALLDLGFLEHAEVLNYCFPTLHRWNGPSAVEDLEALWDQEPANPRLRVALARYRTGQGRLEEARAILTACREEFPKSVSTAAALLALLYEEERWEEMEEIVEQLPPIDDKHPWLLLRMRGHVLSHQNRFIDAIDCFDRVLKSNPADAECWIGKASAYGGLNDSMNQQECARRASELARIQNRIGGALSNQKDTSVLVEIAEIASENDLHAEALLIVRLGLKRDAQHEKLLAMQQRLSSRSNTP